MTPLPRGIILDATPRLRPALAEADYIAAEDTRRTRNLAQALGVELRGQVLSNFDHNEQDRVEQLIHHARTATVVVVTDAGMPIVSDPGFPLVAAAHDAGVPITCFPGPSAVPVAIALSGLHVGKFAFDGFAPRKSGVRRAWLESLITEERAVCFFESPHRIAATLAEAVEILGPNRRAAVARELTKIYEEVRRGTLAELADWTAGGIKGEITCVIEGALPETRTIELHELIAQVNELVAGGERLKTACATVAAAHKVSKKELYDAVLRSRQ